MSLQELADGKYHAIPCPAHGGRKRNLSVRFDPASGWSLYCWSRGCAYKEIALALGIALEKRGGIDNRPYRVATYIGGDGKPFDAYRKNFPADFDDAARCNWRDCDTPTTPHKHVWIKRGGKINGAKPLVWGEDDDARTLLWSEGEKTAAHLLAAGLDGYTPISTPNGSGSVQSVDWSLLGGRELLIWPDNDEPGYKARREIAKRAVDAGVKALFTVDVDGLPQGADAADLDDEKLLEVLATRRAFISESAPPPSSPFPLTLVGGYGERPRIYGGAHAPLEQQTDEARAALAAYSKSFSPPPVYRASDGYVDVNNERVVPHPKATLAVTLGRAAHWYTYDRNGDEKPCHPNTGVVDAIWQAPAMDEIPELIGVRAAETLVEDENGRPVLLAEDGYHAQSGILLALRSRPAAYTIAEAREKLANLLIDFPFVSHADYALALGLALSHIARPYTGRAPLFLIDKPSQGTGASLLGDTLRGLALDQPPAAPLAWAGTEDERRKALTAELLDAPDTLFLDNLVGRITSTSLAQTLTQGGYSDRLLGSTKRVRVTFNGVMVGTANNAYLSPDLVRRSVRIRLDRKRAVVAGWKPPNGWEHPDPVKSARSPEYRGALVSLVRHWLAEGAPDGKEDKMAFTLWARTVGGILACAGVKGFLQGAEPEDEETDGWQAFVTEWWNRLAGEPVLTRTLYEWTVGEDKAIDSPVELRGGTDRARRDAFTRAVGKVRDRVYEVDDVGELRIERLPRVAAGMRYQLTLVRAAGAASMLASEPCPICGRDTAARDAFGQCADRANCESARAAR